MSVDRVWVVMERARFEEPSLVALARTQEGAQREAQDYVGHSLTWEHRNSIFDPQDYLVGTDPGGDEYHIYEHEVSDR